MSPGILENLEIGRYKTLYFKNQRVEAKLLLQLVMLYALVGPPDMLHSRSHSAYLWFFPVIPG